MWYNTTKFEESKHPKDKEGKFTFKNPSDKYLKSAEYQDRLRTHSEKRKQLENKYNSELPGKPKKKYNKNKEDLTSDVMYFYSSNRKEIEKMVVLQ